ncbi:MAG: MarR family transcriptional regulator [Pseudomonadota bacterium]
MSDFDLTDFLPYLLNRAAEKASRDFQAVYKRDYGMLRTEWRVLFHLGIYGAMTARKICQRGELHKTKVSRAVAALQSKRFLKRQRSQIDGREELLRLTNSGYLVFRHLRDQAADYHLALAQHFSEDEFQQFKASLKKIIADR